jgi:hypothetical protein
MTIIHVRAQKKTKVWTFGSADPSSNTVIMFSNMVIRRYGTMAKWTNRLSNVLEYYLEITPGEETPRFIKTVGVKSRKETAISQSHSLWNK